MKHSTFFWFILPSLSLMILFIALPIVSVVIQSLHVEHEQVLVISKSCDPFGCKETTSLDQEAMEKLREENPLGRFNGLGTYTNRSHFAVEEVSKAWQVSTSFREFWQQVLNLPFYKALTFTITYTIVLRLSGCSRGQQSPENIEGPYDLCLTPANDRDPPCGIIDPILDGGRGWYYRSHFATCLQ